MLLAKRAARTYLTPIRPDFVMRIQPSETLLFKTDLELARMPAHERLADKLADALLALSDASAIADDEDAIDLRRFRAPLAGMYDDVNDMMKGITD
jgi:hypothetical protein